MNLALLSVWEDARVWAHSFDMAGEIGWVNWEVGLIGKERGKEGWKEEAIVLPDQL